MNLKKLKVLGVIIVFLLSFLFHSIYDIFPCFITSILFPVNESIWEHMKLILLCYFVFYFLECFIIKKYNIKALNIKASLIIEIVFNICFYLTIYTPIYYFIGYNTFITLSTYFISIIITQFISYKILTSNNKYNFLNKYSYLLVFIVFIIFVYLTYYPYKNIIFIDSANKKIGINNYY